MKRYLSLVLFAAGWLATAPAYPTVRELNLADELRERTIDVQPGEALSFKIVNRVPQHRYTVIVRVETQSIPELRPPGPPLLEGGENPCDPVVEVTHNILRATEEAEVATLVTRGRELLAAGQCPQPTTVLGLQTALDRTEIPIRQEFILKENELVRITIHRPDGDEIKEWVFVFTTPPRGSWFTSYGFVFLGDQDETFFSRETGDGKFEIARDNSSGGELSNLNFAPSFFYTWLPRRDESRDLSPGFTFGLGFDQSNPVLFAGGSLNYNRFVSLIAGAAIHQQKRLNGQFHPGQPLEELLDDEALHEEKFGINYFLGLSFRFNANPFSNDEDDATQPEPTQPAPASGGNS
jgi:hypothetical protein